MVSLQPQRRQRIPWVTLSNKGRRNISWARSVGKSLQCEQTYCEDGCPLSANFGPIVGRKEVLDQFMHSPTVVDTLLRKKKLRSFCQSFWWPHIRPDVERNLAWCLPCAGRSIAWRKRIKKLVPFKDRIQFQTIAIDILGPVTITNASRVKHIIAMIDIFTKYIVGFPLRSTESLDVANEIVGIWVLRFDVPDALYRYQSRNIGRKLCKLLKIDKRRTSTYHSQGNGQKEIHNSVIAAKTEVWS